MERNPELTGTLPLAPIRRLPKQAPSSSSAQARVALIRVQHAQPCRIHQRPRRGEIDNVAPNCYCRGGTEVFLSSCGSPRWTAATDLCDIKSMHMFLCQFWSAVLRRQKLLIWSILRPASRSAVPFCTDSSKSKNILFLCITSPCWRMFNVLLPNTEHISIPVS